MSKAALAEYIKERVEGANSLSLSELTTEAVAWVRNDPALLSALLEESVRPIVYAAAQRAVAASRGGLTLVQGAGRTVKTTTLRAETKLRAKFQTFMEYDGSRHVLLLAMTRPQLLRAATEREARGAVEMHYAELWRRLALALPDDRTPLSAKYSAESIAALSAEISGGPVEALAAD